MTGESSLDGVLREVKDEVGIVLDRRNGKLISQTRRDTVQDFYDVWQ